MGFEKILFAFAPFFLPSFKELAKTKSFERGVWSTFPLELRAQEVCPMLAQMAVFRSLIRTSFQRYWPRALKIYDFRNRSIVVHFSRQRNSPPLTANSVRPLRRGETTAFSFKMPPWNLGF